MTPDHETLRAMYWSMLDGAVGDQFLGTLVQVLEDWS